MPNFEELFPSGNQHMRDLFGVYLERKFKESGLSKKELCQILGIDSKRWLRLEEGKARLDSDLFQKLVETLNLVEDELIELHQISRVRVINEVAEAFCENFPS